MTWSSESTARSSARSRSNSASFTARTTRLPNLGVIGNSSSQPVATIDRPRLHTIERPTYPRKTGNAVRPSAALFI